MDILERIIENLTSDEVRRFKILSNRFKAEEEKKLILLFDAIRAGEFASSEEAVVARLYGSSDSRARNSYYRLRNKLMSNLEKSLLFYHFNYKNAIEAYSNLQLALLFRERGLYRETYFYLRKAEKVAGEHEQFTLLEVVYDEMVKLAVYYEVDIEQVIALRRQNLSKMEVLRSHSEVLGTITRQLSRRNYARSKKSQSVIETLEKIRSQLEEHQELFHSSSGKMLIIKTVASLLIQKSAYSELSEYARQALIDFEQTGETHPTRLMLRIWRINSLQKLLDLGEAATEIEVLGEDLARYNRQNYAEFAFHYYSRKAYNLKLNGHWTEASTVLDEAFSQREILRNEAHELYLLISRADQQFCYGSYPEAGATVARILQHPAYTAADEGLRLYIRIFELVNVFETGNMPGADALSEEIRRTFRTLLRDEDYTRAARFLDIMQRMITARTEDKKISLRAAWRNFTEVIPRSEVGDNSIILYELYLRSLLPGEPSYRDLLTAMVKRGG